MAFDFPSVEWTAAYKDAINANPRYKSAGKDWTHGAVSMIVKADPSVGINEDLGMWLEVHQGECKKNVRTDVRSKSRRSSFCCGGKLPSVETSH